MLGLGSPPSPGVLIDQGVVLHDQEAVVVRLQYDHELKGGEGPAHIPLGDIAVKAAEDAGVVAADKEDFEALQVEMAVDGSCQQLVHRHPLHSLDLHEQAHQVSRNPALSDQRQLGALHKIGIVGDRLANGQAIPGHSAGHIPQ